MDNEEPQLTQIANLQISDDGHKLPEQSRIPTLQIPRPFNFNDLIHQWQPMGIRVKLNLPFTGNDQDFLFAIRNGPFIPMPGYLYQDSNAQITVSDTGSADYSTRNFSKQTKYDSYAWNNMFPVRHGTALLQTTDPGKSSVYITQYDAPPSFSAFSTMFRRWRGTIHYRIRVVSGFTTQGYIFMSMIRNSPSIPMVYNESTTTAGPPRQDDSYREAMQNSYIMGDTAMFRHFELQVPYEYPTPYYDQYAWIGKRSRPGRYFLSSNTDSDSSKATNRYQFNIRPIQYEPHGDNWIVMGLRGTLESSVQNSQVTFELEYRAGDDFQFADPFLPFPDFYAATNQQIRDFGSPVPFRTLPSSTSFSGGFVSPTKVTKEQAARLKQIADREKQLAARRRLTRSITNDDLAQYQRDQQDYDSDGHDTIDEDTRSVASDIGDVSSLRQSLRKSLRDKLPK
nr:MAG: putative capsid protein [Polycipiviridae sp.]